MIYAPIRPTWTKSMVERRLVEAEIVLNQTTTHPMQIRRRASDVPPHISTEEDRIIIERARLENLKLEDYYDDAGNVIKPIPSSLRAGVPPTDSVTRAMQCFWWITYVRTPRARIALQTYVALHARGRQGYPSIIAKRLAAKGLPTTPSVRAAYRLKESAVEMIVVGLNAANVPVIVMEEAA